jgi:hypothetical protein
MLNRLRNKLWISHSLWLFIQAIVFIFGLISAYFLGLFIELKLNKLSFELPIIFVWIWLSLFIYLKFKLEDVFLDCIDDGE